jgi:superfamily II DNA or RNA helicase
MNDSGFKVDEVSSETEEELEINCLELEGKNTLVLYPEQVEHFKRLQAIHSKFPFALDLSMLGSGKTYTATYLALSEKYKHVIVICPVSVSSKWMKMKKDFGLPLRSVLSYQSLRSNKFKQPKHGYLHRRDFSNFVLSEFGILQEKEEAEFSTTANYKKLVEEGLLLILDEIQHIKNISVQFHAALKMIREITLTREDGVNSEGESGEGKRSREREGLEKIGIKGPSRVLLLSGSPMDKKEHALHLFRSLGVMTSDRVAQMNIHTRELEWRGMREIHDFCSELASCPEKAFFESFESYSFKLFQDVFKFFCSSFMLAVKSDFKLDKKNSYFSVEDDDAEILKRGLKGLKTASNFDGEVVNIAGGAGAGAAAMAAVTRSLQIIETGKINLFAKLARRELEKTMCKVVVAVNFSETINDLVALLQDFEPLILRGSTSSKKRAEVLEDFAENSARKRLLIANLSVASTGIDLDDKFGDFPRVALVSPNYSTITSYQFGFRFLRADTKSNTAVHFVFAKYAGKTKENSSDIIEIKVLNALARKSTIMKEVTSEQALSHVVFPGDHKDFIEDF